MSSWEVLASPLSSTIQTKRVQADTMCRRKLSKENKGSIPSPDSESLLRFHDNSLDNCSDENEPLISLKKKPITVATTNESSNDGTPLIQLKNKYGEFG